MVRDLMDGQIEDVLIEFDPHGSLATTHQSQGSDMGLFAGFLGWDPADERLVRSAEVIHEVGMNVRFEIVPIHAGHPNTYQITASNRDESHQLVAISTGGGAIEVVKVDGVQVSMAGDYHETLFYFESGGEQLLAALESRVLVDSIRVMGNGETNFVEIKSQAFLPPQIVAELREQFDIHTIKQIEPVLPVFSRQGMKVPFTTCAEMLAYNQDKDLPLWRLALHYEQARGDMSDQEVIQKMTAIIEIMEAAIQNGLAGTTYPDRILGYQSGGFQAQLDQRGLIDSGALNRMILYTTALMETKSSMGLIVAAPTAGACGGLPGACIGAAHAMGLPRERLSKAMLAGGLIGIFIAVQATFAAEVGGCQAECGAGSGMAAAALVSLVGGSTQQCIHAASMALQNILGMICDPVANRVEVPCLGKNVMAASNALACANMALADYDPVIPLDEVIQTMDAVGKMLPSELRCTAKGGLSITPSSKRIEKSLAQ
jgi:L-serine dehydratase